MIGSQFQSGSLDAMEVAASFPRRFGTGVIDQDPSHHPGCNREKMGLVGDIRCARAKHSKVDFIDQRGGLQGVVFPLFSKVFPGNSAKLSVDQRHQFLGRFGIAFSHPPKQLRDLGIHDQTFPSVVSHGWEEDLGPTVETVSCQARVRLIGNAEERYGLTRAFRQMFSLIGESKRGMRPRKDS